MKKHLFILGFLLAGFAAVGQTISQEYRFLIKRADSLYNKKEFKNSAQTFATAFRVDVPAGMMMISHRYKAARAWSMANYVDSAFAVLEPLVAKRFYADYSEISTDPDLNSLHADKRWQPLLNDVIREKQRREAKLNKPLTAQLDSIFSDDQTYRHMVESVEEKYGRESKEIKDLWKMIQLKDSINLIKVSAILDKYGWLGVDVVSWNGNSALFLVIQHADLKTQEKYLPMIRDAVKKGIQDGSSLAMLEDRVALRQGKKQVYGTQIHRDEKTGKFFIPPIEDEPSVNKRRDSVGLEPLEDYVKRWGIEYVLPKPDTTINTLDLTASLKNNAVKVNRLDSLNSSVYKLLDNFQLIMIGEMHGTNEPAKFVTGLVKLLTGNGDSVQVGFEIPEDGMTKFLSEHTDNSIYSSEFFTRTPMDGRENLAWAEAISILNKNKRVKLFFFAGAISFSNPDGSKYYKVKNQIQKNPHYITITLSGGVHNRILPHKGKSTMACLLKADKELNISNKLCSLDHIYKSGTMINNDGSGLKLKEVNNPDTVYSTSVDSENYLYLFQDSTTNQYNGVLFTKFVSAAKLVKAK
ncbi:MAG TPA: DUF6624 domain-containing protein [Candidatus Brocadiaceae bacterium]